MSTIKLNAKATVFMPSGASTEIKTTPPSNPTISSPVLAAQPSPSLASPLRVGIKLNAKASVFTPFSPTSEKNSSMSPPTPLTAPATATSPPTPFKLSEAADPQKRNDSRTTPDKERSHKKSVDIVDPKHESQSAAAPVAAAVAAGPSGLRPQGNSSGSSNNSAAPSKRPDSTTKRSSDTTAAAAVAATSTATTTAAADHSSTTTTTSTSTSTTSNTNKLPDRESLEPPRRGRSRTSSEAETVAAEVEAEKSLEKTTRDSLEEKIKKSREYLLSLRYTPASQIVPKALLDHPMFSESGKATPEGGWTSPKSGGGGRKANGTGKGGGGGGGPQSPRRGGARKGGRGGGGGGRVDAPIPLIRVEPLSKTDNRYQIARDLDEDTKTLRTLQSIMNKVTPEKFDTLLKKASELKIDTPEMLKEAVSIVFEKALAEPNFSPTYAEFCRKLAQSLPSLTVDTNTFSFRKLLLNQCQAEFEGKHADPKDLSTLSEEDQVVAGLAKRRMLGTIRFIGELFVRKVLAVGIMKNCIHLLLRDAALAENIEALCDLLKTVGKELDRLEKENAKAAAASNTKDKQQQHDTTSSSSSSSSNSNFMDTLFTQLHQLTEPKDRMSSRIRFMIRDVLDLRRDEWVARRQQAVAQKLSDIRKENADKLAGSTTSSSSSSGNKKSTSGGGAGGKTTSGGGVDSRKSKDRYAIRDGAKGGSSSTSTSGTSTPKKPATAKGGKASPAKSHAGDVEDEWESVPASRNARNTKKVNRSQDVRGSETTTGGGKKNKSDTSSSSTTATPVKHSSSSSSSSAAHKSHQTNNKVSGGSGGAGSSGGGGGAKDKDKDKPTVVKKSNVFSDLGTEDDDEEEEEEEEAAAAAEDQEEAEGEEDEEGEADDGEGEEEEEEDVFEEEQKSTHKVGHHSSSSSSSASTASHSNRGSSSSSSSSSSSKSNKKQGGGGGGRSGNAHSNNNKKSNNSSLSEADVDHKIKALISEYFTAQDKNEAVLCVNELEADKWHFKIVSLGLNLVMELKDKERGLLRDLFQHFYDEKLLTPDNFTEGFDESFGILDEIAIDVPQAPIYVAKILASVIVSGALHLSILTSDAALSLKDSGKLSVLAVALLKEIETLKGHSTLMALWNHSSLDFKQLMQPESTESVDTFLGKHGLSDLVR